MINTILVNKIKKAVDFRANQLELKKTRKLLEKNSINV
jgi:hypothetical protein